jgi:ADP-ribose pyrophosphatase YjhB (NUDIX family)
MAFIKDHMIVDPALREAIIARVLAQNFGDAPDAAAHDLGMIDLPDGTATRLFARHAADAVLLDDRDQVVLITRRHEPGKGKLALPGGFLDEVDGVVEDGLTAALREAVEETGISAALRTWCTTFAAGPRRFYRGFDIRCAWNDIAGTAVQKGDFFTVSTQGFGIHVPGDLAALPLAAGDDAASVHVVYVAYLQERMFAVPDHLPMIRDALACLPRSCR